MKENLLCQCGTLVNQNGVCPNTTCNYRSADAAKNIGNLIFFKTTDGKTWEPVIPSQVPKQISQDSDMIGMMLHEKITVQLVDDDVIYMANLLDE